MLPVEGELDALGPVAVEVFLRELGAEGVRQVHAAGRQQAGLVFLEDIHREAEFVVEETDVEADVGHVGLQPGEVLVDEGGAGHAVGDGARGVFPPSAAADAVTGDPLESVACVLTHDAPGGAQLEVAYPLDVILEPVFLADTPACGDDGEGSPAHIGVITVRAVPAHGGLQQVLAGIVVVETADEAELALVVFVAAGGLVLVARVVQFALGEEVEVLVDAVPIVVAHDRLEDGGGADVVLLDLLLVVDLGLVVIDVEVVVGVLDLDVRVPVLVRDSPRDLVVGVHLPVAAQDLGLREALVEGDRTLQFETLEPGGRIGEGKDGLDRIVDVVVVAALGYVGLGHRVVGLSVLDAVEVGPVIERGDVQGREDRLVRQGADRAAEDVEHVRGRIPAVVHVAGDIGRKLEVLGQVGGDDAAETPFVVVDVAGLEQAVVRGIVDVEIILHALDAAVGRQGILLAGGELLAGGVIPVRGHVVDDLAVLAEGVLSRAPGLQFLRGDVLRVACVDVGGVAQPIVLIAVGHAHAVGRGGETHVGVELEARRAVVAAGLGRHDDDAVTGIDAVDGSGCVLQDREGLDVFRVELVEVRSVAVDAVDDVERTAEAADVDRVVVGARGGGVVTDVQAGHLSLELGHEVVGGRGQDLLAGDVGHRAGDHRLLLDAVADDHALLEVLVVFHQRDFQRRGRFRLERVGEIAQARGLDIAARRDAEAELSVEVCDGVGVTRADQDGAGDGLALVVHHRTGDAYILRMRRCPRAQKRKAQQDLK